MGPMVQPGPVLITAALPFECAAVTPLLGDLRIDAPNGPYKRWYGSYADLEVVVLETGMGLDSTEAALASALPEIRPGCIISTGLAGGLSASVRPGDAVVPDRP